MGGVSAGRARDAGEEVVDAQDKEEGEAEAEAAARNRPDLSDKDDCSLLVVLLLSIVLTRNSSLYWQIF